jgi:hypothetical protein
VLLQLSTHKLAVHQTPVTVSITVKSKAKGQFQLPDIGVCLSPRRGCGSNTNTESCLSAGTGIMTLNDGFTDLQNSSLVMRTETVRGLTSVFAL